MPHFRTTDIIPAQRIGDIYIGMPYHELQAWGLDGFQCKRWGTELQHMTLVGDNIKIWLRGDLLTVEQIMAFGEYPGFFFGKTRIGIGSQLSEAVSVGYEIFDNEEDDIYQLRGIEGIGFEMGDTSDDYTWDELTAPIDSIIVFNPKFSFF